eukprot:6492062-Amphidinium_carterae.1
MRLLAGLLRTTSNCGLVAHEAGGHEVALKGREVALGHVHGGVGREGIVPSAQHQSRTLLRGDRQTYLVVVERRGWFPFTAMAAKPSTKKRLRDMDSDDQVDWYNRQAEVVQNRGMAKRLCALVKSNPEVMPGILSHLKSKGIKLPELQRKRKPKKKGLLTAGGDGAEDDDDDDDAESDEEGVERAEGSKKESSLSRLRKGSGIVDPDPANWVPHCYTTLGCCRGPWLTPLLETISPVAYSPYNLTGYKKRLGNPGAEAYQKKLLELLAFAAGVDGSLPLVGDMRHYPTLKQELKARAEELSMRCNNVVLPPDWSVHGVYTLVQKEGRIMLQEQYGGRQSSDISAGVLAHFGSTIGEGINLHVVNNFSEKAATIVNLVTGASKAASELLADAVNLPEPGKMRLR